MRIVDIRECQRQHYYIEQNPKMPVRKPPPRRLGRVQGHVQRGIRRAFVVNSGRALSTRELMQFTHALALPGAAILSPAAALSLA
jgi:hypothetical protein